MPATFSDFHYPTRWHQDNWGVVKTRPPISTLILSEVFTVTHTDGFQFDAVLSLERSDRRFIWMVLAKIPSQTSQEFLESLPYQKWYGCGGGFTEVSLAHVDAELDYPFGKLMYKKSGRLCEMWNQPCFMHTVWLAARIGLRANGFEIANEVFPYLNRKDLK